MAVDDAGRGRMQRPEAEELGLEARHFGLRDPVDIGYAVRVRLGADRVQLLELLLARRDDQLAAAPVRHAMRGAVVVEKALAFDAAARFQRSLRVINAGVNYLGVPRAGAQACGKSHRGRAQDDLSSGERQLARDREADHARADDDGVNAIHGAAAARSRRRLRRRTPRRSPSAAPCRRTASRGAC